MPLAVITFCAISKKKKPPSRAASSDPATWSVLLELGRDSIESAIEGRTHCIDAGDNHDRNTSRDQAVFNRGGARLILQKRKGFKHPRPLARWTGGSTQSTDEAGVTGGFDCPSHGTVLLQLRRDGGELAVEGGADRIDGSNDHDRNASGDQAVLNRGRSRLVL